MVSVGEEEEGHSMLMTENRKGAGTNSGDSGAWNPQAQQYGQPQKRPSNKYRTMSKTKLSESSLEYGSTAWSVSQSVNQNVYLYRPLARYKVVQKNIHSQFTRFHARAHTHTHTQHARTHARTHAHTHTHVRTCPHTRLHCHFIVTELYYLYHCFKSTLQYDRYLGCMQSRIHKTALARFRLSVSRINCHRLRFSAALDQYNCPFRITSTEDECHKHYVVAMPSVHRLENKIIF